MGDLSAAYRLPINKMLANGDRRLVLEHSKQFGERFYLFFCFLANTGIRVCEGVHLRKEHFLGRAQVQITRRKKKVFKPEIISIPKALADLLEPKCIGKQGWLFEGSNGICELVRRPTFRNLVCPECQRQLSDGQIIKKSGDLKRLFMAHLVNEHKKDAGEVALWMDIESKSDVVRLCEGGHMSVRDAQVKWLLSVTSAHLYAHGRGIHTLRHGYAMDLYAKTRDLRATQLALGHCSSQITERYANVLDMEAKINSLDPMV